MAKQKVTDERKGIATVLSTYRKMLRNGKIKEGGSAHKRLNQLTLKWG